MSTLFVSECIESIISSAHTHNIKLENGIEFFCGDGSLYTKSLSLKIKQMIGIDIDSKKGEHLKSMIPNISFICADSIKYANNYTGSTYDIISMDNPLCIFGSYCEHFDILESVHKFVHSDAGSVVTFDIVTNPYDYDAEKNRHWIEKRKRYYNLDSGNLDLDFALEFYKDKLCHQGLKVIESKYTLREERDGNNYFYMLIYVVTKEMTNKCELL